MALPNIVKSIWSDLTGYVFPSFGLSSSPSAPDVDTCDSNIATPLSSFLRPVRNVDKRPVPIVPITPTPADATLGRLRVSAVERKQKAQTVSLSNEPHDTADSPRTATKDPITEADGISVYSMATKTGNSIMSPYKPESHLSVVNLKWFLSVENLVRTSENPKKVGKNAKFLYYCILNYVGLIFRM